MKRIAIIASVVLVIVLGVWWSSRTKLQAKADEIQTVTVQKTDFQKIITVSGKTAAERKVDVKFQTSGRLAWVGVKEGDRVSAYQSLAKLDVREVQKNLEKSLREYSSERNDFEEQRQDPALTDTIRRILQKNQWDLEQAVLDVELKHLAVEYATLVTPIGGIVTHIDTPIAGVNITPATAVFSVVDPKSIIFEANVDEMDIDDLTVGKKATILLDAYPEATFSGTVSFVSYWSEQSSAGATVFPVKIAFTTNPDVVRFGLNGDLRIISQHVNDALTVPLAAIREDKDGQYVHVRQNNIYKKTPVETGLRSDDEAVVLSGLSAGDRVVTKGFANIKK